MISVAASVFQSRLGKRFWANSAVWSWLSPAVVAFSAPFNLGSGIPIDTACILTHMCAPSWMILKPTQLSEIVLDHPSGIGAVDAAKTGMGGIWFVDGSAPLLWRAPFPLHIQQRLVSNDNPGGDLSISDFKLAGVVAPHDILAQSVDARSCTFTILNDNSPAVSRASKGSITSHDSAAYLLWLSSLHQRHHQYYLRYDHIAGAANAMADDASRLASY
jgi:hypothetical protein